ncbi:NUDIX hydrolase [Archangium primigenium]|uniref:NUDIX hydrolase n=1 Tax=[Archangium] primigenium TaxID=2792470 RepID=UPI00195CA6E4|nr:NUDIX hydrolase [Archangium primigenium]MBM7113045.1 NUDIX hydrolase [Archangium primigenium]
MSDGRAWRGDVKARLYERVRERGHESLTAFADARPTASLVELADELGTEDIAAVQVFSGLVAEAERSGRVTRLVRGQFVRELFQAFPTGWPSAPDDSTRFELAHALARWTSYTPDTHKERVRQARAALRASPPPAGWRPLGPDDELLRTLLPDEAV